MIHISISNDLWSRLRALAKRHRDMVKGVDRRDAGDSSETGADTSDEQGRRESCRGFAAT
jgi:hypothetical protein